jgi:hypothetical protein
VSLALAQTFSSLTLELSAIDQVILRPGLRLGLSARRRRKPLLFLIVNIHPWDVKGEAMSNSNALSFVGQIMTEYKAAQKAEGDVFKHAIACGKFLNLAKENVKAAKGKWLPWLKENCPDIPQTTASLYMRLAENEETIADCKSIREADLFLRVQSDQERTKSETKEKSLADETNNALLARTPASLDLTTTFLNVGVDEVCTALTQAWDADQLRDLYSRLGNHLSLPVVAPHAPARDLVSVQ